MGNKKSRKVEICIRVTPPLLEDKREAAKKVIELMNEEIERRLL